MADDLTLAVALVQEASGVVESLTWTAYTGDGTLDPAAGVFEVDCSEFVTYLLQQVAPNHLSAIAPDPGRGRRLAGSYYAFARGLPHHLKDGWRQVRRLSEAVPGDIVAWQHVDAQGDSGHVFLVTAPAVPAADGLLSVAVADSSNVLHFDDSRGPSKPFATGVGTGSICFTVDDDGVPTGFLFGPGDQVHPAPTAIARIEPFGAA